MKHDCPSDTSLLVARSILLASKDAHLRPLVAPGEAEVLAGILAQTRDAPWFKFILKNDRARQMVFWLEPLMVAGVIAHYLARKRWIEIKVRESLAEGTRQVIILGAGLDTLAARLAVEFPQILFFRAGSSRDPSGQAADAGPYPESPINPRGLRHRIHRHSHP